MAEMGMFAQLGLQVAGGAAALYADRPGVLPPEWTLHIGADPAKGQPGIAVTPGAMVALGTTLLLAIAGKRVPGHALLANLAGGAVIAEAAKVTNDSLIPEIEKYLGGGLPKCAPGQLPAPGVCVAGLPFAYAPQRWVPEQELAAFYPGRAA